MAAAFRDVMDRVAGQAATAAIGRSTSGSADTNLQLGQGLPGDEAKAYLEQAKTAIKRCSPPPRMAARRRPTRMPSLIVHKRLGDCLIALGEYKPAIAQYAAALAPSR